MTLSINPVLPVIAAQGAAPGLLLQPGTVVDAEVLKVLSDNLVRIAIAGVAIDAFTEIPLQPGQTLQLEASQTEAGIRLAVIEPGADAPSGASPKPVGFTGGTMPAGSAGAETEAGTATGGSPATAAGVAGRAVDLAVSVAFNPSIRATSVADTLMPIERSAVAVATEIAAARQGSLAPLFADLGVVAAASVLPPKLQQAVLQVLAQRPSLDAKLNGNDVKNAFEKSGIFLEASLAREGVSQRAGSPDLKAALIVLRQTLLSSLDQVESEAMPLAGAPRQPAGPDVAAAPRQAAPPLVPSLSADPDPQELVLSQLRAAPAESPVTAWSLSRIMRPDAGPRAGAAGAARVLLQAAMQNLQSEPGSIARSVTMHLEGQGDDVTFHTNTPPPPFRGALPSAQPAALPSIDPTAPQATALRHLLDDTDAAISRQTLLQVASLPDPVADSSVGRTDPSAPRWSFEIPFAMPQGTAVAQFEISRDGGDRQPGTSKQIWRARFSLDVEPAGPVHALVSLSGERTSVRMWAERPATAARLRAGAAQLGQALSAADLKPGDIVIQDGAPPQPVPAPAGHFLDRAL